MKSREDFVSHAAKEAARGSKWDSVAYMLEILEKSLQRGYTSRKFPRLESEAMRTRGVQQSRY